MIQLEAKNIALSKLKASQAKLEAVQTKLEAVQAELEISQQQAIQLKKQIQELGNLHGKTSYDSIKAFFGNYSFHSFEWILLPMRIFLGLTFIYAGMQKLIDPQFFNPSMPTYIGNQIRGMAYGSPLHDFLISIALPHAAFFGWVTAIGEIAIGLGTYAGFLFRLAAFFGMLLNLTFFLSASWNTYPYFLGSDIVFIFCWIMMILGGPLNTGLSSIDHWLVDQLVLARHTQQKLPFVLQLYILLVVAGTSEMNANQMTRRRLPEYQHKINNPLKEQIEQNITLKDWIVGTATVVGIMALCIPLHIFSNNPISSTTSTTISLNPILLFFTAMLAGALNAVGGGGGLVTVPAMVFTGMSPLQANTTTTIVLWPGDIAGLSAYRRELRQVHRGPMFPLIGISFIGSILGSILLLYTSQEAFVHLLPYLQLIATLFFILSGPIAKRIRTSNSKGKGPLSLSTIIGVSVAQFLIAIYGGYFGGGIGILILATLALIGMENMPSMIGLKVLLAACINAVATITFIIANAVVWPQAILMIIGTLVGTYSGAYIVHKIEQRWIRGFVIVSGLVITVYLFVHS